MRACRTLTPARDFWPPAHKLCCRYCRLRQSVRRRRSIQRGRAWLRPALAAHSPVANALAAPADKGSLILRPEDLTIARVPFEGLQSLSVTMCYGPPGRSVIAAQPRLMMLGNSGLLTSMSFICYTYAYLSTVCRCYPWSNIRPRSQKARQT